ncbi:hypothetical protein LINPERPRIM_LOCUS16377 [Linum perenne]
MNSINKLGFILTIIFLLSLLLLTLQIFYILRRKRWLRQSGEGDAKSPTTPSNKELLYLLCFCGKNRQANRIEPADVGAITSAAAPIDEELEEMLKLHQLYGLSRALFTIKEEPEIDIDAADSEVVVIQVDDGEEDGVTPFTTPCGSPPYYTPSPSPPRD